MEDYVIEVTIFGMGDKVFDGFGGRLWEEADCDVAMGCVDSGGCTRGSFFGVGGGLGVYVAWFLVLNVALGFCDAILMLDDGV